MTKDKALRVRRRGVTLAICAVLLAAMWALSHWPAALEYVYARRAGFQLARALSRVSGLVPISLAEFTLLGVVAGLLALFAIAVVQIARRQRRIGNAIASGSLWLLTSTGVVLVLFYALWGLLYARAPLAERFGWAPIERPADAADGQRQTDEIAGLARQLVEATNQSYREFAGSDDLGHPSERSAGVPNLDALLDAAYPRVRQRLELEAAFAAARGRAKPLLASALLNHLQLGGFYFPWTGEANYNRLMPAPTLPHAVAHEKAHQRGIAREDEANFIGYVVCAMSDDAYVRYSGYLFAHQQLLGELARRDRGRAREIANLLSNGVRRDLEAIRVFWQQYEGRASRVSESVNNTFLKSQGEKRGIAAYAASRNLIVLFARNNNGRATMAPY